ncbi:MAG: hypothetical protein ACLFQP_09475 [Halothece sp.]
MTDSLNREYLYEITDRDRLRVRVNTSHHPNRPTYAIQLECWFEKVGRWQQVIRADDFDDRPHFDIHSPDGTTTKQWLYDYGDNKMNMKAAYQFLTKNWEAQRTRYENELYN